MEKKRKAEGVGYFLALQWKKPIKRFRTIFSARSHLFGLFGQKKFTQLWGGVTCAAYSRPIQPRKGYKDVYGP